jgi:hypothetical protein
MSYNAILAIVAGGCLLAIGIPWLVLMWQTMRLKVMKRAFKDMGDE